tara:strand:- start:124 stop:546 length:423 start_codon:yes stop_codon:yes gene_type:complete
MDYYVNYEKILDKFGPSTNEIINKILSEMDIKRKVSIKYLADEFIKILASSYSTSTTNIENLSTTLLKNILYENSNFAVLIQYSSIKDKLNKEMNYYSLKQSGIWSNNYDQYFLHVINKKGGRIPKMNTTLREVINFSLK